MIKARRTMQQQQTKMDKKKEPMRRYKIAKLFRSENELAVYTDGGFRELKLQDETRECAGWGYAAVQRGDSDRHEDGHIVHEDLGVVCAGPRKDGYDGAAVRSSNTVEITAMIRALRWVSTLELRWFCLLQVGFPKEPFFAFFLAGMLFWLSA